MPPKKPAKLSDEAVSSSSVEINKEEALDGKAKTEPGVDAVSSQVPANPTTMVMVKEALKELDSRKGVSSQAIRNYIKQKYPSVDLVRLKYMLRNALTKGIESGVFVRPANSTVTTGALGKFRIAVKDKAKKTQLKNTENKDPNVKVPKTAKTVAKVSKETDEKGAEKMQRGKGLQKEKGSKDQKTKVKGAAASKVAPAKKPKTKSAEAGSQLKPKSKTTKAAQSEVAEMKGSKSSKKPAGNKADEGPPTKAPRKRAAKTAE